MEEILGLIHSLAENILEDPPDLTELIGMTEQDRLTQRVQDGKEPTHTVVTPAHPDQNPSYSHPHSQPQGRDRSLSAPAEAEEKTVSFYHVAEVADKIKVIPPPGWSVEVQDAMRITGAAAVPLLPEPQQQEAASPSQRPQFFTSEASPDRRVDFIIPPALPFDAKVAFAEFDRTVKIPSLGSDPDNTALPDYDPVTPVESSENYVVESLQDILQQDNITDRMVYP